MDNGTSTALTGKETLTTIADADFKEIESKPLPPANGLSDEDNAFLASFSDKRRKRLLWKVDIRLLPMLGMYYLFAYLDRANIGKL